MHGKVAGEIMPVEIGRDLLVSSHAGTRLPIAAGRLGHRALPLCPFPVARDAGMFSLTHSFRSKESKKNRPLWVPAGRDHVMTPYGGMVHIR